MKELLLMCSCKTHVLKIIYFEDKTLYLQILPSNTSFFGRLKFLLKRNIECIDDVVLFEKEILLLKNFMSEI